MNFASLLLADTPSHVGMHNLNAMLAQDDRHPSHIFPSTLV
jgi:hypothetical protein